MAEQNNEKQTINFAGREIDKKEFGRRVQAKLGAWMDYQGLQGDERTDFINALNDKMNGLLSGDYTSSDFGVIQGGAPNQENQYKQNGSRSDSKFSLSRRHGFNPGENVDVYLNGIAGTMDEGASSSAKSSKKSDWNKNAMAQQIMESIFGEGNEASVAQMKLWADKYDPVSNGVRTTLGRKDYLIKQINNYRDKVANGEYNLEGEDQIKELTKIDNLVQALNNDDNFNMNKVAPWLSNLLFTEEDYYNTPEEKQAAEQQALVKKGEDYIKNGGENPYNKETQLELWQAAEDARKAQIEKNQQNEFDNYSIRSNTLRGEHFLPKWDQISDDSIFGDWDPNGEYGWQHMLDALYKVNRDYSGDLGLGADLYSGVLGIGGDSTTSNDTFRGIVPNRYIDEIVEPNDWLSGHQTKGSHMFRSANAYKGKYLSDYLNHFISAEPDRFRIAPNTQNYILPSMVDWNKGTAYLINRKMNQKGSIKQVNIADLLPKIKEDNPGLYQELYQYYLQSKVKSAKQGGVLKAQFGGTLIANDIKNSQAIDDQNAEIASMGQSKFDKQNLRNQVIEGNNVNLSTQDWMRIGAAAADLTSAVAAFVPGGGTAVAAATGLGSTFTHLAADITDPSLSFGSKLGNLGMNLGLDLVSLIPGLNIGAGAAKIVKPIAKLVPKLLPIAIGAGMAPEFIDALKKVGNGKNDLTANDLRTLAQGMSIIAGSNRVAGSTLKASKLNKSGYGKNFKFSTTKPNQKKTGEFPVEFVHNGQTKPSSLTLQDIKDINAGGKDNALNIFRQKIAAKTGLKPDEISFAGNVRFDKKLSFMNHKLKPSSNEEILTDVEKSPEMMKFYAERLQKNAEFRAKHPIFSKYFKTDLEMQGIVPTSNPRTFWNNDFYSPFAFGVGKMMPGKTGDSFRTRASSIITKGQKSVDGNPATPTAKKQTEIDNINTQIKNTQQSLDNTNKELKLANTSDKRLGVFERAVGRQNKINEHISQVEGKIKDINRISQLERRLNIAKGAKRSSNSIQQQRVVQQLESEINSLKTKTGKKDLSKELQTLQKRLNNLKSMPKQIQQKRLQEIETRIQQIKSAKANESQLKQASENGRKQLTKYDKQLQTIDNDLKFATYNHYRDLVRRVYGLKHGGILKANDGTKVEKPKQTSTTNSTTKPATNSNTNTGTLGNTSKTNTGTLGNTPSTNTGSLGNPKKPSDSEFKGYDNGLNPQSHWGIPESNLMLSLFQNEKNSLAHRTNYGILQEQLLKIPFHKDPMIYGYKVHTSKPLEDTVAKIKSNFNLLGSQAAAGTADLGSAFAYRLNAQKAANDQIFPYVKEQANFVQTGEDKAREAAYQTMQSYHDTGEFNHEQDVNKYNSDRDAKSQYLSQYGNILMNDLTMRQRGLATTAKYNYQRSLLADDAMYNYRRLLDKKTNNPKDWTQDDEVQLARAYRQWIKVNRLSPIGMPYTGYQQYYTTNKPFETFFN